MSYQAPAITEVGSVRGLTLGLNVFSHEKDETAWFLPFGNLPSHPDNPTGSR